MTVMRSIRLRQALFQTLLAFSISVPLAVSSLQSAAVADPLPLRTASNLTCLEVDNSGPSIDIPNLIDTSFGCYELRLNGESVSLQGRSLEQAIADLERNQSAHPGVQLDGFFNGLKIGYELYWDGVRVGYEPSWTLQQAIENLEWNQATYPDKQVEGRFYGFKIGYELYWNDVRVGYEPSWTYEQALQNLQWNQQTHSDTVVRGSYNGFSMP